MKRILLSIQLMCAMITPSLLANEAKTYLLKAVSSEFNAEFAGFIDNILRVVSSQNFFEITSSIIKEHKPANDQELYQLLLPRINAIKPLLTPYYKLRSLQHQKSILSNQIQQLLGDKKQINGAVEIGSPGTYISTLSQPITGDVYVVNEAQSITDRLQCGGRKPNNKFIPLNDYAPLSENTIPSQSVDLVICFIGLHHCPSEKLADFVASIARILRPGGIFILRDHDAHNEKAMIMAHAAHSTFNVIIANASLNEEMTEYRNFKSMNSWITILEEYGFTVGSERLLQDGDPSLNTMIKCTKNACTDSEKLAELEYKKQTDTLFSRPVLMPQDPEWINVDLAKEYALFLNHTPWYNFPYYQSIKAYWRVFFAAWKQARKKNSFWQVMTSDALVTNATVGAFTTIEFLAKSIVAYPTRWLSAGTAHLRVQMIIKDPHDQINTLTHLKVLEAHKPFKIIELPRYIDFLTALEKLIDTDIELENIAGQKEVLCKVRYHLNRHNTTTVSDALQYSPEYRWTLPTQPNYEYATYLIPVPKLKSLMTTCKEKDIELLYIHESRDA